MTLPFKKGSGFKVSRIRISECEIKKNKNLPVRKALKFSISLILEISVLGLLSSVLCILKPET